jgi:hypothetical protein
VGRYGREERCAEWEGRAQQRDVLSGKVGYRGELCLEERSDAEERCVL